MLIKITPFNLKAALARSGDQRYHLETSVIVGIAAAAGGSPLSPVIAGIAPALRND